MSTLLLLFSSQGYYLDEWLVCALNQAKFDTYVGDTYSFAKPPNSWFQEMPLAWVSPISTHPSDIPDCLGHQFLEVPGRLTHDFFPHSMEVALSVSHYRSHKVSSGGQFITSITFRLLGFNNNSLWILGIVIVPMTAIHISNRFPTSWFATNALSSSGCTHTYQHTNPWWCAILGKQFCLFSSHLRQDTIEWLRGKKS